MDLKKLEDFIGLAKKMGVSRLEYKYEDENFVVELPHLHAASAASYFQSPAAASAPVDAPGKVQAKNGNNLREVTSPFVGTFYRSSGPNAGPFAKVGDKIVPGKTLCIIEAMKIMNEIEADIGGEIVEICVENETYVEFGQVLFRLKA